MKRSFTFSLSRKISTAPYENLDIFAAEGLEMEIAPSSLDEKRFEKEKGDLVDRVTKLVAH